MASISKGTNGSKMIQFVGADGKRRTIRLGKLSMKQAESIKVRVEALNAAAISKYPLDSDTAKWCAEIGDDLAAKFAAVGLTPERGSALLAEFIDSYITQRTDVKPSTRLNLNVSKTRLVEFFGKDKPLRSFTPGDADAFLLWLRERYPSPATASRSVKRAQQFFRAAVRRRLIPSNPFDGLKLPDQTNEDRKAFISRVTAQRVLDACPDAEWRLIFALCRFAGLRCPSELMVLEWSDVDWANNKFRVDSPKTGERWVPIFAELRPYLEEAFTCRRNGDLIGARPRSDERDGGRGPDR